MFTVLTYNILHGGRQREEALITIIAEQHPDIIILQELLDDGLLKRLAATLNADSFCARGNSRYHLGLLSRYPITHAFNYRRWPIRAALLEATIAFLGHQFHLWGVHLMPHLGIPFELWRVAEVHAILR